MLRDTAKAGTLLQGSSPRLTTGRPSSFSSSISGRIIGQQSQGVVAGQVTDFGRVRPAEGGVLRQVNAALFVSRAAEIQKKRGRYEDK